MDVYFQLFECLPDTVIVADERRIITMNSQGEKIFGYAREEIMGKTIEMLIPQRFASVLAEHHSDFAAKPRMKRMGAGLELFARRKDGTEFPMEARLCPIPTSKGRSLVAVVIRDITERKLAEEAQVSLIDQLQSALKEIRNLRGLLPICAYCKSIRNDTGSWQNIEAYVKEHTDVDFTHGVCPKCYDQQMTELRAIKLGTEASTRHQSSI